MNYFDQFNLWLNRATDDQDLIVELQAIQGEKKEIESRFCRNLEFGTGGLRGLIGAGSNRMNIYTVANATQGYSNYLREIFDTPSVAIAYDSRIKSTLFAETAAQVFAANGIKVHIFRELMPTPVLSFAVRELHCSGGVVITASHNPSRYNGYKVYGSDGCQITLDAAKAILERINSVEIFDGVKKLPFSSGVDEGLISYISEELITGYIHAVSSQSMEKEAIDKNVAITYTPLNGTGLKCVTRCLQENGFTKIIVPTEQEQPDGNFLTCPYPNPEIREALSVGLEWAKRTNSDLLLASDPDCDRIGVAVKNGDDYTLLTGNQIGVLLLEYICKRRIAYGTMPEHPIVIKTIVTTDMAEKIAKKYGVKIINVLTGFKFIGEQIGYLEASGEVNRYIFGFEESYGYLSGSFVRDKDGVNAALLICEMFAYYKSLGKSLLDVLNELFTTFGVFKETLQSFSFEGPEGSEKIQRIMTNLRDNPPKIILGKRLWAISDYKKSQTIFDDGHIEKIQLPMSDVLKFNLADDISIVIRPSGTEPKLKSYYSVKAETWEESVRWTEEFQAYFANYIYSFGGNP